MVESGHYYDRNGNPVFEVPNKTKGGMRPTTLKDCKKLGLLPSVSTILRILAKPELDVWKQKQVLLASLTLPRLVDETDESYCERIIEDAFKQVDDAADLGTRVHNAIENHFQGHPYDKELTPYIEGVEKWVKENKVTFLSHEVRLKNGNYAGTTDGIVIVEGREGEGIADFKTRRSNPKYPMKPWQTEPLQIAAYGNACGSRFGVNIFISTTEKGENGLPRIEEAWYDNAEMNRNFLCFQCLLEAWKILNDYSPDGWERITI